MPEMKTMVLSVMIYKALNAKGAGLGNASIGIIEQAIAEYEAAQPSANCLNCGGWTFYQVVGSPEKCAKCGTARSTNSPGKTTKNPKNRFP